jgi:UDP-glucose 4-epimerase
MSSIFTLATAVLQRRHIRVAGMSIGRDWIYAPDVAGGLAHLATQPTLPHDLFNLGSGTRTTLEQIVRILQNLVPGLAIDTSPAEQTDVTHAAGDERSALDVTRIRATGFEAATDAETGLRRYLEWLEGEGRFPLRT